MGHLHEISDLQYSPMLGRNTASDFHVLIKDRLSLHRAVSTVHLTRSVIRMADDSPCSSRKTQPLPAPVATQRITIVNNYGEKLVGVLHDICSSELVILCHGFLSSKECQSLVTIASVLAKEGISSFLFDFAGNGESEGSYLSGTYGREAEDLRAVILHFSRGKRVIRAIVGHSKGGNVALLYASRYDDVRTFVNVSGCFNLQRGVAEQLGKDFMQRIKRDGFIDVKNKTGKVKYRITRENLEDRLISDVGQTCLLIEKTCRVLTVHGSDDALVPAEDAMEFGKFISNHKLHMIEGANHEYTSHQAELASIVVDFIKADGNDTPKAPSFLKAKQSVGGRL